MNLWYEIGYTLRSIRRKIGFSVLCILVIVLGLSITLPLYSFAKNFVYTTLPYPDGHNLFTVRQIDSRTNSGPNGSNFDFYQFQTLTQTSSTVAELGAFYQSGFTLSDGEFAQQFSGVHMTAKALEFTAVNPILGRTLSSVDELPGADPAVVIGYDVWQ
ncbi:MAG: ABC transporter permease, partial [Sphingomonadales bacterium]|nr:ABC transporter permease [Sphingomonadales bacterium]